MANSQLFMNNNSNDVMDISLPVSSKSKYRVNGNDNMIIELNTNDTNIIVRLSTAIPKLEAMQEKVSEMFDDTDITEESTADDMKKVADMLLAVDKEMREQIDYIFDSPVSEILVPSGSMYDPIDGSFRFEYIIEGLLDLYDKKLQDEYQLMDKKVSKYTDRYK